MTTTEFRKKVNDVAASISIIAAVIALIFYFSSMSFTVNDNKENKAEKSEVEYLAKNVSSFIESQKTINKEQCIINKSNNDIINELSYLIKDAKKSNTDMKEILNCINTGVSKVDKNLKNYTNWYINKKTMAND